MQTRPRKRWPDFMRSLRGLRPGRVWWCCGVRALSEEIDTGGSGLCPDGAAG